MNVSDLWRRNFLVLLGFLIVFQVTQVVLIELFPNFDGGASVTLFAPENGETKKLNAKLRTRKAQKSEKKSEKTPATSDENVSDKKDIEAAEDAV